jgi:hypothetical protein
MFCACCRHTGTRLTIPTSCLVLPQACTQARLHACPPRRWHPTLPLGPRPSALRCRQRQPPAPPTLMRPQRSRRRQVACRTGQRVRRLLAGRRSRGQGSTASGCHHPQHPRAASPTHSRAPPRRRAPAQGLQVRSIPFIYTISVRYSVQATVVLQAHSCKRTSG